MHTPGQPPEKFVWPTFRYRDAKAAIRFLEDAFGFVASLVVPGQSDEEVAHAELLWPEGGGVMVGSQSAGDDSRAVRPDGPGWCYVVTDGPDALHDRALKAGAEIVDGLKEEEYGSRGFSAKDPEGNLWFFGTYRGAPSPS